MIRVFCDIDEKNGVIFDSVPAAINFAIGYTLKNPEDYARVYGPEKRFRNANLSLIIYQGKIIDE